MRATHPWPSSEPSVTLASGSSGRIYDRPFRSSRPGTVYAQASKKRPSGDQLRACSGVPSSQDRTTWSVPDTRTCTALCLSPSMYAMNVEPGEKDTHSAAAWPYVAVKSMRWRCVVPRDRHARLSTCASHVRRVARLLNK